MTTKFLKQFKFEISPPISLVLIEVQGNYIVSHYYHNTDTFESGVYCRHDLAMAEHNYYERKRQHTNLTFYEQVRRRVLQLNTYLKEKAGPDPEEDVSHFAAGITDLVDILLDEQDRRKGGSLARRLKDIIKGAIGPESVSWSEIVYTMEAEINKELQLEEKDG